MALLVLATRRASRIGLVDALMTNYGSPGQLADYWRQFEKITRAAGTDPSIYVIELETLAFGDMGHMAHLRLVRDWFIAWQDSRALHRHLDSVSPETPIRDIVDLCRVWESHADMEDRSAVITRHFLPVGDCTGYVTFILDLHYGMSLALFVSFSLWYNVFALVSS